MITNINRLLKFANCINLSHNCCELNYLKIIVSILENLQNGAIEFEYFVNG